MSVLTPLPAGTRTPETTINGNWLLIEAALFPSGSIITADEVSHWKLGEVSGRRYDSIGANHLVDNATVTQAEGIRSPSAQFTSANSEYLNIADNASLSTGNIDFSFSGWFYLDSKAVNHTLLSKWGAAGQFEYILVYNQTPDRFEFYVSNDGTATVLAQASTFGSPSTGTWYFITVYHDAANNLIGISVNNGAFNTTAHTTGVFDSTSEFRIGASAAAAFQYHNGRIANVRFWKRMLTAAEITYLYNAGLGDPD